VIGCEDRLRNDLYCVRWSVKLYLLTHSLVGCCCGFLHSGVLLVNQPTVLKHCLPFCATVCYVVCLSQCYYYFAIVENLVLRFAWTASVTVQLYSFIDSEILATILASLEVFRSQQLCSVYFCLLPFCLVFVTHFTTRFVH